MQRSRPPSGNDTSSSGAGALTHANNASSIAQGGRVVVGSAVIAAAIAGVASIVARLLLGISTPAELYGDRLTTLIPLPIFSRLLSLFGTNAKHWYYGSLVVCAVVLTALFGIAYWVARGRLLSLTGSSSSARRIFTSDPSVLEIPIIALLLWFLSAGVLAPVIGGGVLGAALPSGIGETLLAQLFPDCAFAVAFVVLLRRELRLVDERSAATQAAGDVGMAGGRQLPRRRMLRQVGVAVVVLAGGALVWEAISDGLGSVLGIPGPRRPQLRLSRQPDRIVPPPTPSYGEWAPVSGITPEVTLPSNFYYVSKDLVSDPNLSVSNWQLQISGLVTTPYNLSYAQLSALPSQQQYHTLECISNEVGGNLMSNGQFTGTSLADVLNHAGIRAGASEVIFRAADGYSDTLHLSQALDPRSLIVYQLDGEPLPQAHGYPARLLIPGLYGMKNGKWLTSLEVSAGGYTGYWEQQGWTREAHVKMTARIDTPHDGDLLVAQATYVAGVAYSGDQGIARVDVSMDGGVTWTPAILRRPLGALTWVLWEVPWMPASGQHILVARAIDLSGTVQTINEAPPLPDGASGYHAVTVVVR